MYLLRQTVTGVVFALVLLYGIAEWVVVTWGLEIVIGFALLAVVADAMTGIITGFPR